MKKESEDESWSNLDPIKFLKLIWITGQKKSGFSHLLIIMCLFQGLGSFSALVYG